VLEVQRISQASARQRAGRAGRVRPGKVIRLYSLDDFVRRPAEDVPEIRRRELSQVVLELETLGLADVPWYEAPPEQALQTARSLLERLGAREHGREMARYPLHPRLARMLVAAKERRVVNEACRVAAILSAGDRFDSPDLLHLIDRELPPRTEQVRAQIRRIAGRAGRDKGDETALLQSVLCGFPDRVGRKRNDHEALLSNGVTAVLPSGTVPDFFVALDVEERGDRGGPLIRLAAPVRPEWLLDLFPECVTERVGTVWNRTAERVESTSALLYDDLVIEQSSSGAVDSDAASRMVAERAAEAGLHRFADPEALQELLDRTAFAAEHGSIPELKEEHVRAALEQLAQGCRSFAELREACRDGGLLGALRGQLGKAERLLEEIAPERIRLGRRMIKVHYPRGQTPWIESRLQDFFGMREAPRVARGAVSVVVRLLAPNNRPVQMTTDLAGFWERLYPKVRQELMRRYPKHAWPDNPVRP
jgi:ATP-dependent helicase HrpB